MDLVKEMVLVHVTHEPITCELRCSMLYNENLTQISFMHEEFQLSDYVYHEFHETCHSVTFRFMKKDSIRCCNTTTPESIHTKDESKRGSAFAFIFGVN